MYFGSFWHAFGYLGGQSSLDSLLTKEDVTIEDILNEENIITELKSGATKFSEHMVSHPDKLERMIEFIINEPDINEGIDSNICYKYPFISSEIFGVQPPKIASFMLEEWDLDNESNQKEDQENQENDPDSDARDNKEDNQDDKNPQPVLQNNFFEEKTEEQKEENDEEDQQTEEKTEEQKDENDKEDQQTEEQQEESSKNVEKNEDEKVDQDQISEEQKLETNIEQNDEDKTKQEQVEVGQKSDSTEETQKQDFDEAQYQDSKYSEEKVDNQVVQQLPEGFEEIEEEPVVQSQKPAKIKGKQLLAKLLSYILQRNELNSTSAGYFQKAIFMLISKSGSFWNYLIENPQYIQALLDHSYNKSICEIILKLLLIECTEKNEQDDGDNENKKEQVDSYFQQRRDLLQKLFVQFNESNESEQLENISAIFIEIIQTLGSSDRNSNHFYDSLGLEICELKNISILVNKMKQGENYIVFNSVNVLNQLVLYFQLKQQQKNESEEEDQVNFESNSDRENFPIEFFISNFQTFIQLLFSNTQTSAEYVTSYGGTIQPFGYHRLKLLELMSNLLKIRNSEIQNLVCESNLLAFCLDVMIKYQWNNMLHSFIDRIIRNVLDSDSQKLKDNLFQDADLVTRLNHIFHDNEEAPGSCKTPIKKGYIGYFISIAKYLQQIEDQEGLREYLQLNQSWVQLRDNEISIAVDIQNQTLGGYEDNKKIESACEEDDNNMDLDIKRIYQKFHNYFNNNKQEDENLADNYDQAEDEDFPSHMKALQEVEAIQPFSNIKPQELDYDESHYLKEMSSHFWKNIQHDHYQLDDILKNDVIQ